MRRTLLASLVLLPLAASASDCPRPAVVTLTGEAGPAGWQRQVLPLVDDELAASKLERCAGPPLASVSIDWKPDDTVVLSVSGFTGNVRRSVERSLDVSTLPQSTYAITLAAMVGDFLFEVLAPPKSARVDGGTERPAGPPAVEAPPPRLTTLAVSVSGELFSGPAQQLGADVELRRQLMGPLGLQVSLGGRWGAPAKGTQGRVEVVTGAAQLGLWWRLVDLPSLGLDVVTSLRVLLSRLEGVPLAGQRGVVAAGVALVPRAGLRLAWRLGGIDLELAASVGVAARGTAFREEAGTIGGLLGLEGGLALGVGRRW